MCSPLSSDAPAPAPEFGMAPCKALLNNCQNYDCGGECGPNSNNMKMILITRCGDIWIACR